MRKTIAVITGGNSSECVISIKSAKTILENLDAEKYISYHVEIKGACWSAVLDEKRTFEIDKNDFSFIIEGVKIVFDAALIMIHGDPGENGRLQGYFDMLNIPYTSSGVLSSSVTFDKHFTKQYLKSYGIVSAEWVLLNKCLGYDLESVSAKIGFPCFVKPNNAGSSFGISKVNSFEQLKDAVENALSEDQEILVEQMIAGTEITCGILRANNKVYKLPITEIVSKTGFFDYDAKYTTGLADEITPARIPESLTNKCQELSLKIYDIFNCKWFARVDYIVKDNELFVLEINTIPGMSKESIVPKMLKSGDLSLSELLNEILSDTVK